MTQSYPTSKTSTLPGSSSDQRRRVERATERVGAFIRNPESHDFDRLALEVAQLQGEFLPGYARLFRARGRDIGKLARWQDAPAIPTSAFQQQTLTLRPSERTFRSSGTSRGTQQRSVHHHGNLDLYRLIIHQTFPDAVLGSRTSPVPILSLIAPLALIPDSSLGFMTDVVIAAYGSDDSLFAFSDGQFDPCLAMTWLAERSTSEQAAGPVVLTTALALWSLLEALDARSQPIEFPPTATIMETGGFKTRRFDLSRAELLTRLEVVCGVGPEQVIREYGMTELTSQAYARAQDDDGETFTVPPWVRVRALDPVDGLEVPSPQIGLLAFFDLGNVASAASIVTEDLGTVEPCGRRFHLVGRAADAQLRGCSLATEHLLS